MGVGDQGDLRSLLLQRTTRSRVKINSARSYPGAALDFVCFFFGAGLRISMHSIIVIAKETYVF